MVNYDYHYLEDISIPSPVVKKIVDVALVQSRLLIWKQYYPVAFSILEANTTIDAIYYSNIIECSTNGTLASTVDKKRVEQLLKGDEPKNELETKMVSYHKAREYVHQTARDHPLTPDYIKKVHKILTEDYHSLAGQLRHDNRPYKAYCTMAVIRKPMDYKLLEKNLQRFCEAAESSIQSENIDRLLLMSYIISDFQIMSPFRCGNGRMYRLLFEYLLLRFDMDMIKYVSLDKEFFIDVRNHMESIYRSTDRKNGDYIDYIPLIGNFMDCLWNAASRLDMMFP